MSRSYQRGIPGLGMAGHTSPVRGGTDEWLTPPEIIAALGPFDLDPCAAPEPRPWPTAVEHITAEVDGLTRDWSGRVWLNPPYGPEAELWLSRLADHGNGIALIFARTETRAFFEQVWRRADALLFIRDRLTFHRPDGTKAEMNSGSPSVLVAYGLENVIRLPKCGIHGSYVRMWSVK